MPHVAPFRGLRYDPAVAGELSRLTTPPYDVISEPRRHRYREASPFNAVHVDLPEGVEDPNDPENRYARAGALLSSWERSGALVRPDEPCYYAYEVAWTASDGTQAHLRGVFVALELEPWGGSVIPHEHTMPGPVEDRLRLLRATATHLSPIYGTVSGPCAAARGTPGAHVSPTPGGGAAGRRGRHAPFVGDLRERSRSRPGCATRTS